MIRKLILPVLVIILVAWIAGCSDNSTQNDVTESANVNADMGGYTATSEAPGFGDTELLASDAAEKEVTDPLLGTPSVTQYTEDTTAAMFHFRAVWGRLEYDSTVTTQTDWTGSLTVSRGAEIIRKTIAFELGQDYIPTRTDRQVVDWVSYTTVSYDGVVIDLFVPPATPTFDTSFTYETDSLGNIIDSTMVIDTTTPEPVTVDFQTGPYSRTFTLEDLAALDTVVELDDGNSIAFSAMQIYRYRCPRGFVAGGWGVDTTGQGVFRGQWLAWDGSIAGWLRGTYGTDDTGRNVFYGKWINNAGDFEGFLAGTWKGHPNYHANPRAHERAGGWFKGRIFNADTVAIGQLQGKYVSSNGTRGNFFQGRWRLDCYDAPDSTAYPYDDGFEEPRD